MWKLISQSIVSQKVNSKMKIKYLHTLNDASGRRRYLCSEECVVICKCFLTQPATTMTTAAPVTQVRQHPVITCTVLPPIL